MDSQNNVIVGRLYVTKNRLFPIMKIAMFAIFVRVRYIDLIRNAVLTTWLTTNLSTYHKYRVLFYCHSYSEFCSSVLLPWFHFSCFYNKKNKMRFSIFSNRQQEQLKSLEDSLVISDMGTMVSSILINLSDN